MYEGVFFFSSYIEMREDWIKNSLNGYTPCCILTEYLVLYSIQWDKTSIDRVIVIFHCGTFLLRLRTSL